MIAVLKPSNPFAVGVVGLGVGEQHAHAYARHAAVRPIYISADPISNAKPFGPPIKELSWMLFFPGIDQCVIDPS